MTALTPQPGAELLDWPFNTVGPHARGIASVPQAPHLQNGEDASAPCVGAGGLNQMPHQVGSSSAVSAVAVSSTWSSAGSLRVRLTLRSELFRRPGLFPPAASGDKKIPKAQTRSTQSLYPVSYAQVQGGGGFLGLAPGHGEEGRSGSRPRAPAPSPATFLPGGLLTVN